MMSASATTHLILGLGETGLSVAEYLLAQQQPFRVMDTRSEPPGVAQLNTLSPNTPVHCGGWHDTWLAEAEHLYLSPGLPLAEPRIQNAIARGVQLHNDIDLYLQATTAEVIAVTGTNGKSTVVHLLEYLARQLGLSAMAGGNIGYPALKLLSQPHDWAILELSSFQLELVQCLQARVSMILNISPDHLDRYPNLAAYKAAKQRIFWGAQAWVYHQDDTSSYPDQALEGPMQGYALDRIAPDLLSMVHQPPYWHLYLGTQCVYTWSQPPIVGRHNQLNALAALAAGHLCGWDLSQMAAALSTYQGLPHRTEWVARIQDVTFINDSKGTNVGATLAAIDGLMPQCLGRFHLLLGGQDKGAEFSPLWQRCKELGIQLYAFGESAPRWHQHNAAIEVFATLDAAFAEVLCRVAPNDWVVLSPAGASFDQYSGYPARGNHFKQLVQQWQRMEASS